MPSAVSWARACVCMAGRRPSVSASRASTAAWGSRRCAAIVSGGFGGSRRTAATPIGGRHRGRRGGAYVVAVGQGLLTVASVFDADDAGFGELAHRPVDGVDRAAQAPGQGLPGWHPGPGAVPVAKQQGVQAERAVGEGCVDYPFGDDREPRFLDDEGAVGGGCGVRRWGFSVTVMAFRAGALRVGKADSTAALDGGARQECVRNAPELHGRSGVKRPDRHDGRAGDRRSGPIQADSGIRRMRASTDQKVGGSNPSGRALVRQKVDASEMSGAFGFLDEPAGQRPVVGFRPCRRGGPGGCSVQWSARAGAVGLGGIPISIPTSIPTYIPTSL